MALAARYDISADAARLGIVTKGQAPPVLMAGASRPAAATQSFVLMGSVGQCASSAKSVARLMVGRMSFYGVRNVRRASGLAIRCRAECRRRCSPGASAPCTISSTGAYKPASERAGNGTLAGRFVVNSVCPPSLASAPSMQIIWWYSQSVRTKGNRNACAD